MKTLTLELPEHVELSSAKLLIALSLFDNEILTSGQAAELSGLSREKFLLEVSKYGLSVFGETSEDLENIEKLNV
jgi:predicted HTH domain antitoxin